VKEKININEFDSKLNQNKVVGPYDKALITQSYLNTISKIQKSTIVEITEFKDLIEFSSLDELISKLE
jgi:hypothetical protein